MSCEPTPRSVDVIKCLRARVRELEDRVARMSFAQKEFQLKCVDLELEARIAKNRFDYTKGLLALKDDVLEITSREHVRFMQMYLDRDIEMRALRETNNTLVKKILELGPVIYNAGGGSVIRECAKEPELKRFPATTTATLSQHQPFNLACPPSTPAARRPALSAKPPLRMAWTRKLVAQTDA